MKQQLLKVALIITSVVTISDWACGQNREIAVTFDDLPIMGPAESLEDARYVTSALLAKTRNIPVTGFVNEKKLYFAGEIDDRTALLEAWLKQGHDLGNHTFSHVPVNTTSFEDYTADIVRGETVTAMLLARYGRRLRYFRHPQLRTGPTAEYRGRLEDFLKQRQYRVAPVTIDNNEYLFARKYRDSTSKAERLRIAAEYIRYMERVTEHFEKLSRDFLGHEIRQILLLHANELNADHFERLAEMYKKRGYRFISLDAALEDDAYRLSEVTSMRGLSWIHRWMLASGLEIREEPLEPAWIRGR